ncbi:MAG TPA: L,D-transpeptidase family protein, partial [Novosphingobium sp.]|nr:L,D-transpeptidase family protein [Novosphingobium sp.]
LLAGSAEAAGSARAVGQGPEPLLPPTPPTPRPTPSTAATQKAFDAAFPLAPGTQPVSAAPVPVEEPVAQWNVADATALLETIEGIDKEGLFPNDYQPEALRAAIAAGMGPALDQQASRSFDWLAEDLRDGRTPWPARVQWFAIDPDQDLLPTKDLLAQALTTHDVPGVLASLDPTYPDYAALRDALATISPTDRRRRSLIRVNMDRWRWLPRDLAQGGQNYLLANVPEFQLRLMRYFQVVRTYKTIVGKPGRTATPQLAERVQAVVFNPTWTVPQSIIDHEGLADKLRAHPRPGYKLIENPDGGVTIVQQPGPNNSLGQMKIDMPNPHAIYLHDTPEKALFNQPVRAFSHGCVRTERAVELGMTMAMMGAGATPERAVELYKAGKYARVVMTRTFPVYLTYFTVGRDVNGQMSIFNDLYARDEPVLASFAQPRQLHTTQRTSTDEVIVAQDPL